MSARIGTLRLQTKIISQLNPSLPSVDCGFRSVYRRETITIRRVGVRCNGCEDDTLMMNDRPILPPHFLETKYLYITFNKLFHHRVPSSEQERSRTFPFWQYYISYLCVQI